MLPNSLFCEKCIKNGLQRQYTPILKLDNLGVNLYDCFSIIPATKTEAYLLLMNTNKLLKKLMALLLMNCLQYFINKHEKIKKTNFLIPILENENTKI